MISLNNSAGTLRDRFIEEQEYIQSYVELLERKTSPDSQVINSLVGLLEKYNLGKGDELLNHTSPFSVLTKHTFKRRYIKLDVNDDLLNRSSSWYRYDPDQLPQISAKLQQLRPDIEEAIREAEVALDSLQRPRESVSIRILPLLRECDEYLISILTHDSSSEFIESVSNQLKEYLKQAELTQDAPIFIGDDFGGYDELVEHSIKSALYSIQEEKVKELYNILHSINDLDITARMFKSDTEINILRQGFITLTTIFDATVFDLVKVALKRDFFNLIALFGRQDKVSMDKISKYSSFDEFRDELIEEQLKSKYLREVLFILNGNKVTLTDAAQGDEFIHLLEIVLRRNIHIHNRGVVDNKYLETNVYNLTAGTVAHIDAQYWERANRLSLSCIKLITDWINTLPLN